MKNLDVYNKLRDMHNILKEVMLHYNEMSNWKKNAVDAVTSVLYLAESIFTKDGKLSDDDK